jgi:A/G-specific adenine glycosylase
MLQQTSTSRVIRAVGEVPGAVPDAEACADASLAEVLVAWSGLGYPRRAKSLHDAARIIRDDFGGEVPSEDW